MVVAYLATVLLFPVLPLSLHARPPVYSVLGLIAVLAAWSGVVARPHSRERWYFLVAGFTAWWVGDLFYGLLGGVDTPGTRPAVSNVLYFAGYALVAGGVLRLAARQEGAVSRVWVLDALMACVALAVPLFAVLGAAPVSVSSASTLILSGYLISDLFVVAVLFRLLALDRLHGPTRLVTAAVVASLAADATFQACAVTGHPTLSAWVAEGWLVGYALIALATWQATDQDPRPRNGSAGIGVPSLAVVAALCTLPGVTLAVQGLRGDAIAWKQIAAGVVVLALLMLARMAHLLRLLGAQSEALRELSRVDALTGLPNRRSWDEELSRSCTLGPPFVVAVLDIDRFKQFNDEHGHPVGDDLLRDAAAAWRADLPAEHFLARYGGEEFAVILRGVDVIAAAQVLDRLRHSTPRAQSFSAGVADWRPGTLAVDAFGRADAALMSAKAAGRNQVHLAPEAPIDARGAERTEQSRAQARH
jgi:diguanylate cyclase (GGDEF)-like protein